MTEHQSHWTRYAYLATPYSGLDLDAAFERTAHISRRLFEARIPHVAPIVVGHVPDAQIGPRIEHLTHQCWMSLTAPLLANASVMIFAQLPGSEGSRGMALERIMAGARGIPVIDWPAPCDTIPAVLLDLACPQAESA